MNYFETLEQKRNHVMFYSDRKVDRKLVEQLIKELKLNTCIQEHRGHLIELNSTFNIEYCVSCEEGVQGRYSFSSMILCNISSIEEFKS